MVLVREKSSTMQLLFDKSNLFTKHSAHKIKPVPNRPKSVWTPLLIPIALLSIVVIRKRTSQSFLFILSNFIVPAL